MRRVIIVAGLILAFGTVAVVVTTDDDSPVAAPVTATTEAPAHFPPGSTIVLYDRTTDPQATDAIQYAITIWNGVGANFTLTYERGPGDNACTPHDDIPNKIGICTYPSGSNGNYGRYPYYPLDGSGHVRNGYAGQCSDPPCAGLSEARRILPHEIGHVIGVNDHTGRDATGACSIMSVECYSLEPNQIDRDYLRSLYGHSHGGVTTTAPTTTVAPVTTTAPPGTTTTTRASTTTTRATTTTLAATSTTSPACPILATRYATTTDPAQRAAIRQQQAAYGCPT